MKRERSCSLLIIVLVLHLCGICFQKPSLYLWNWGNNFVPKRSGTVFSKNTYTNKTCSWEDHKVIKIGLWLHSILWSSMQWLYFAWLFVLPVNQKIFRGWQSSKFTNIIMRCKIFFPDSKEFFNGVNAGKPSQLDRMIGNFCKINIFLQI